MKTLSAIRTPELGAGVARALGPHKAVFLRNHGVAVVGASLDESTVLALLLEEACRIQLLALAAGGVGVMFDDTSIARLHHSITRPEQYTINFDYLRRRVQRQEKTP